jgi:hypothetical protein
MSLALPYALGSTTVLASIYVSGAWQLEISWAGAGLLAGAFVMFTAMLISMYRQVRFVLDARRFFGATVVMIAMILFAFVVPRVSGSTASIGMLVLEGSVAGIAMLALLWKNPAMLRLINVRLTNS